MWCYPEQLAPLNYSLIRKCNIWFIVRRADSSWESSLCWMPEEVVRFPQNERTALNLNIKESQIGLIIYSIHTSKANIEEQLENMSSVQCTCSNTLLHYILILYPTKNLRRRGIAPPRSSTDALLAAITLAYTYWDDDAGTILMFCQREPPSESVDAELNCAMYNGMCESEVETLAR